MVLALLLSVIQLVGVSGNYLRARAFFDVNNVKVGDPLVLTIDFLGEADFTDLHPPVLSKVVNRRDWKLDDISAKTSTYQDARRLTYRIRPMREGVLWFPELEFAYDGKTVKTNPIPVHAKPGSQVVVEGLGEVEENGFPKPPDLIRDFGGDNADEEFRWRKALAHPKADAFAEFDFTAGRMNEATCAIREGNWARALNLYRKLEWRIGQTPAVERGIIAALALRYDNPSVELPVWRSVLRPLLKFDWKGRSAIVLGGLLAIALILKLLSLGIRALACVTLMVGLIGSVGAETIETVTTNADGSITKQTVTRSGSGSSSFTITTSSTSGGRGGARQVQSLGGFGRDPFSIFDDDDFPFGRRRQRLPPVKIAVGMRSDKSEVTVGETFNLLLTIEHPRYIAFADGLGLSLVEQDSIKQAAPGYALKAVASKNPTNVIDRLVFPMRALAPINGPIHYSVSGNYTPTQSRGGFGFGLFRETHPFSSGQKVCAFTAKPPPAEGRPADYAGVVAEGLTLMERPDLLQVETNDVITITYRMTVRQGFVPRDFLPKHAAFQWTRSADGNTIEYRRYFVADGAKATPMLEVPYYDPHRRQYSTARCGGFPIKYK